MPDEHLLRNLQNAKIFVEWTEAENREKIKSKENISISLGKIAKLFTDLENVGTAFTGDAKSAYEITHKSGSYRTVTNLHRYVLLLQQSETSLLPINNLNNDIGESKILTDNIFNPFGKIFYYNSTSDISVNDVIESSNLYEQIIFDLRYSFNCGASLIPDRDIFIVATPIINGFAKLHDNPISQTLPTTDNNLIYIYLGHTCSDSLVELSFNHPIFWFKDSSLQLYTGMTNTTYEVATTTSDGLLPKLDGDTAKFLRSDGRWEKPESIANLDIDNICT